MIAYYDHKKTGEIDFDDYMDLMIKKYSDRDPLDEIRRAFKLFDEDGRGNLKKIRIKNKI